MLYLKLVGSEIYFAKMISYLQGKSNALCI